jgi:hypothetical protein
MKVSDTFVCVDRESLKADTEICVFEFICVEGGLKSMKHLKGDASNNSLGIFELLGSADLIGAVQTTFGAT